MIEIEITLPNYLNNEKYVFHYKEEIEFNNLKLENIDEETYDFLFKWSLNKSLNKSNVYKKDAIGEIFLSYYKDGIMYKKTGLYGVQLLTLKKKYVTFIFDYYETSNFFNETNENKLKQNIDLGTKQLHNDKCGYHTHEIKKGVLGSLTKIQEELDELKDAEEQKSKILIMVELSDLYGAIEEYTKPLNISMEDLKTFSDITKRAFKNGRR